MVSGNDALAKCQLRSVIRFPQAEGNSAAEIHRRMRRVYGQNIMSDGVVRELCRIFKDGRVDVCDEEGQRHKSIATEDLVQLVPGTCKWEVSDHPLYSPNLAMSNFYVFLELKNWVGDQSCQKKEELQRNVKADLTSLVATFFEEGIGNLVYRFDKSMNLHGDYVEI
ncbi:hypothetical protein AVEN_245705-1 [Araneus ventricosus]|uniref:Uncharacterized protein n=1 Tax=Araneus ventricosus TaxID=182803 RepID=A0A4Y2FNX6_ARAVE|nr:hypothetical protein AVEN_245705-1 [Araneus ventricosus]